MVDKLGASAMPSNEMSHPSADALEAAKKWAQEEAEHLEEEALAYGDTARARYLFDEAKNYRTLLSALGSDGEESKREHVCGKQGFNGMLGDACPACAALSTPGDANGHA